MSTPDEIRKALGDGSAVLRYVVTDEAWYFHAIRSLREPRVECEMVVGIDALTTDGHDDGCIAEWTITFVQGIGAHHHVFPESFPALSVLIEDLDYLTELTDAISPNSVRSTLDRLGFRDTTARINPNDGPPRDGTPFWAFHEGVSGNRVTYWHRDGGWRFLAEEGGELAAEEGEFRWVAAIHQPTDGAA